MSYELYWHGEPKLAKAYRDAHKLKIQQRNEEMWLQGLYNFTAFSTALSNMHFDGKQYKVNTYMEKPFDLFEKNETQKQADAERERQKVIEKLTKLKRAWDQKGNK